MPPLPKTANHNLGSNYGHHGLMLASLSRTSLSATPSHRDDEEWESDHEQTPALGDTPTEDIGYGVVERTVQDRTIRTLDAEEIRENHMDGI